MTVYYAKQCVWSLPYFHATNFRYSLVKGFGCDKINVVQVLDTHACEWHKKPLRPLPVWLSVIKPRQEVLQRWIRDIWEESFNLKINKDRHIGQ